MSLQKVSINYKIMQIVLINTVKSHYIWLHQKYICRNTLQKYQPRLVGITCSLLDDPRYLKQYMDKTKRHSYLYIIISCILFHKSFQNSEHLTDKKLIDNLCNDVVESIRTKLLTDLQGRSVSWGEQSNIEKQCKFFKRELSNFKKLSKRTP